MGEHCVCVLWCDFEDVFLVGYWFGDRRAGKSEGKGIDGGQLDEGQRRQRFDEEHGCAGVKGFSTAKS